MSILTFQRLSGGVAAAAVVAAVCSAAAGPAQAQSQAPAPTHAQAHRHEAAAPPPPGLNQGRKWATDKALRGGMNRIRALVEPQLGAAHAGKLNPAQYAALAGKVEAEVGGIVANCKLEPKADAVLHGVIGEIAGGTDAMAGKSAETPEQGLVKVAAAVNDYAQRFDHPGFRPIRGIH